LYWQQRTNHFQNNNQVAFGDVSEVFIIAGGREQMVEDLGSMGGLSFVPATNLVLGLSLIVGTTRKMFDGHLGTPSLVGICTMAGNSQGYGGQDSKGRFSTFQAWAQVHNVNFEVYTPNNMTFAELADFLYVCFFHARDVRHLQVAQNLNQIFI
jgi:hypothetical protein